MPKRGPNSCQLTKRGRYVIGYLDATLSAKQRHAARETARTKLESLFKMVKACGPMSEKFQTDCFDVIYHHLQEPVDPRQCESGAALRWVVGSFLGIMNLECAYFERSEAHKATIC